MNIRVHVYLVLIAASIFQTFKHGNPAFIVISILLAMTVMPRDVIDRKLQVCKSLLEQTFTKKQSTDLTVIQTNLLTWDATLLILRQFAKQEENSKIIRLVCSKTAHDANIMQTWYTQRATAMKQWILFRGHVIIFFPLYKTVSFTKNRSLQVRFNAFEHDDSFFYDHYYKAWFCFHLESTEYIAWPLRCNAKAVWKLEGVLHNNAFFKAMPRKFFS